MRDDWYYSGPEGQKGPVTLQQLKDTLAAHASAENVFIWHDSLTDWIRAGDVAEIFADEVSFDRVQPPRAPEREVVSAVPGLLPGLIVLALGGSLFYLGISGNMSRLAQVYGLTTELVDASSGALLFVVGLLMIWATRYRVAAK